MTGQNVQRVNVKTTQEFDITKLDEDNDKEFTMKCLMCMGLYFAFRGLEEHTWLRVHNIVFGYSKKGHELKGHMYVKSTHLNDKTTKLSFTNGRVRDTKRGM